MKHRLSYTVGLMLLRMTGLAVSPADADTVAAGPYYATPSWDQQLPVTTRFIVLSNWVDATYPSGGAAVLDRETGLVWEKSPSTTTSTFEQADVRCLQSQTGGRMGWRMPKSEELFSLLDPTQVGTIAKAALPVGHPFVGTGGQAGFWVMDRDPPPFNNNANLFYVALDFAVLQTAADSVNTPRVWCVRGPAGSPTPW